MVLKGKVIQILDDYRLIVNIGLKDGIRKGMNFFVYQLGIDIKDPETELSLGNIEIVKHRLKVVHAQDNFSIMRSDEYFTPWFFLLAPPSTSGSAFTKKFLLENDCKNEKEKEKCIKIGDLVREDIR
jgi:hypothetical protein